MDQHGAKRTPKRSPKRSKSTQKHTTCNQNGANGTQSTPKGDQTNLIKRCSQKVVSGTPDPVRSNGPGGGAETTCTEGPRLPAEQQKREQNNKYVIFVNLYGNHFKSKNKHHLGSSTPPSPDALRLAAGYPRFPGSP